MFTPQELGLEKPTYTLPEAMNLLSLRRSSIYKLVAVGTLRATKIGRRTVFMAIDLAEFLSNLRAN